jgi:hypothetical protein
VCGRCAQNASAYRFRPHLIKDLSTGLGEGLAFHSAHLAYVLHHIELYSRSFRWQFQRTETEEDKAALISSVGWCSGWKTFLSIVQ